MKKEQQNKIAGGLNGLLNPTPAQQPAQEPEQKAARTRGNYKAVCYAIKPETAERIKFIAYWDRKKINALVDEVLGAYVADWYNKHPFDNGTR